MEVETYKNRYLYTSLGISKVHIQDIDGTDRSLEASQLAD